MAAMMEERAKAAASRHLLAELPKLCECSVFNLDFAKIERSCMGQEHAGAACRTSLDLAVVSSIWAWLPIRLH
jgi:hypothetical protein